MKKRKSINDIAKELNVAISTVSAVLNGKSEERRISSAMRDKVLDYARLSGYQPNMVARSLRTGKSKILGMLVEDIADPFFATISRLVEKNAALHDYKLFYSSTENNPKIAKALIRAFRDRQVDGFIIAPTPGIEREIQALITDQVPLVLFDRYFPGIASNNVIVNNFQGAEHAMEHLIEHQYQHIAFITLDSHQTQMADRLKGYEAAINKAGLESCIKTVQYTLSEDILLQEILLYLQQHPQIDAILFATNYLAISGLKALGQLGRKIPGDVAVIGFDDNTHFGLFTPSITAIAQPIESIGANIVKLLMKCLNEEKQSMHSENIILDTQLIIRDSSKSLAKQKLSLSKSK